MTKSNAVIMYVGRSERGHRAVVLLLMYGRIWGQREKNRQKSAIFYLDIEGFAMCALQNLLFPLLFYRASSTLGTTSRFRLISSYTRDARAFPGNFDFLLSQPSPKRGFSMIFMPRKSWREVCFLMPI